MGKAPPDPGKRRRLFYAIVLSLVVATISTVPAFILVGAAIPGEPITAGDILPAFAYVFTPVFLFYYFIWVRRSTKVLEFEQLARMGEALSRDAHHRSRAVRSKPSR